MVMTTVVSGRQAEPVTEPPEAEVPERATRRTYTAQYKLRILAEYERRDRDGRGALLRREGLFSSLISEWRKQRDAGALQALQVDRRLIRVTRRWHGCDVRMLACSPTWPRRAVLEVQGKLSALLEQLATGGAETSGGEPK